MGVQKDTGCRRLVDKTCIIAGAGSAIGRAVAERLTFEGAFVAGIDLVEHGTGSLSITADLSDEAEVKKVFAHIHEETGRIDFLYNNAGLVSSEDNPRWTPGATRWSESGPQISLLLNYVVNIASLTCSRTILPAVQS